MAQTLRVTGPGPIALAWDPTPHSFPPAWARLRARFHGRKAAPELHFRPHI